MKEIIRKKAEILIKMHYEKYQNRWGESFQETKQYNPAEHLYRIFTEYEFYSRLKLEEEQENIITAYFAKDNDRVFDSMLVSFMLKLGNESESKFGKSQQERIIHNGLEPIIRKIAASIFIKEGVEAILDKQNFNYIG